MWSSTMGQLHKVRLKGIEYTYDGYDFKIDDSIVKNIGSEIREFDQNTKFQLISTIRLPSGKQNYMGYNKNNDFYMTFSEDQIMFI